MERGRATEKDAMDKEDWMITVRSVNKGWDGQERLDEARNER